MTLPDRYPIEDLAADKDKWGYLLYEDDGTMPANVACLTENVVGRRIVASERRRLTEYELRQIVHGNQWGGWNFRGEVLTITLDDGDTVVVGDTSDCCAFTSLDKFLLHPERVDHMILGVGTTGKYTKWHIYADWGDVLELDVSWSCGNPFYYGYGFDITVIPTVLDVGEATE